MPREFFKADGRPESKRDETFRKRVEKISRPKMRDVPQSAKLYETHVRQFPFDWLNDFFRHYYGKTMAGEFTALIHGPKDVEWDETMRDLGIHKTIANRIVLNPTRLENKIDVANEYGLEKPFARKLLLARALIHEAVHAYSKMRASGLELTRRKNGILTVSSGLAVERHAIEHGEIIKSEYDATDVNEGMVDMMAKLIFDEYLEEEGLERLPETGRFKEFFSMEADAYKDQRELIIDLVLSIEKDANVGLEVAFQGLMHQLFAEGALSKELEDWLGEIAGAEILARMKKDSRNRA